MFIEKHVADIKAAFSSINFYKLILAFFVGYLLWQIFRINYPYRMVNMSDLYWASGVGFGALIYGCYIFQDSQNYCEGPSEKVMLLGRLVTAVALGILFVAVWLLNHLN